MLREAEEEEKRMGFLVEGRNKLQEAREEIAKKIMPQVLRTYERLCARYKYSIAPVQKDTCLGCFAKLPTSYAARGRSARTIMTCEHCGRILYWID